MNQDSLPVRHVQAMHVHARNETSGVTINIDFNTEKAFTRAKCLAAKDGWEIEKEVEGKSFVAVARNSSFNEVLAQAENIRDLVEGRSKPPRSLSVAAFKTAADPDADKNSFLCTISFMAMGHQIEAYREFDKDDPRFKIENAQRGSSITLKIRHDAADAFSGKLQEIGLDVMEKRQNVYYADGAQLGRCDTPQQAIKMALNHS